MRLKGKVTLPTQRPLLRCAGEADERRSVPSIQGPDALGMAHPPEMCDFAWI